jgi:hypothetical protein
MINSGNTQCEDQFLYSPNCTLFDRTLQELAAVWNSAFLSLPLKSNPALGTSNDNNIRSNNLQTDEKIWFLVGAVDNKQKIRSIDVPLGRPLFIPILTRDAVLLPNELNCLTDFANLYEDARSYKDRVDKQTIMLEIDNCKFDYNTLIKYYLESIPFKVLIPHDNVYKNTDEPVDPELEDKVVIGVCSGIFVPVKPLPLLSKPHTILFYAKEDGEQDFVIDVKYTINIVANLSDYSFSEI